MSSRRLPLCLPFTVPAFLSGDFLSCSDQAHFCRGRICIHRHSETRLSVHHQLSFQKAPWWLTSPLLLSLSDQVRTKNSIQTITPCKSLASRANHHSPSDGCLPQSCEPIPTSELLHCTKPPVHSLVCVKINLVKLSTVWIWVLLQSS